MIGSKVTEMLVTKTEFLHNFFLNLSLLLFTKVKRQLDQLQQVMNGHWFLEYAILAQKWLKSAGLKKVDFRVFVTHY